MKNDLKYFRILERAGFKAEQAEASLAVIEDAMNSNVVTNLHLLQFQTAMEKDFFKFKSEIRQEFETFKNEVRLEIQEVRTELKTDIQNLRTELKGDIQNLRTELKSDFNAQTNKMLTMMAAMTGIIGGLLALFQFGF